MLVQLLYRYHLINEITKKGKHGFIALLVNSVDSIKVVIKSFTKVEFKLQANLQKELYLELLYTIR